MGEILRVPAQVLPRAEGATQPGDDGHPAVLRRPAQRMGEIGLHLGVQRIALVRTRQRQRHHLPARGVAQRVVGNPAHGGGPLLPGGKIARQSGS
jgi:hypothetical protein